MVNVITPFVRFDTPSVVRLDRLRVIADHRRYQAQVSFCAVDETDLQMLLLQEVTRYPLELNR